MEWLILPALLLVNVALTELAWRANRPKPQPAPEPCQHPWYISGRCIVCGEPL